MKFEVGDIVTVHKYEATGVVTTIDEAFDNIHIEGCYINYQGVKHFVDLTVSLDDVLPVTKVDRGFFLRDLRDIRDWANEILGKHGEPK